MDSPAANPLSPLSPCPVSGGTCYDDIRRNFFLEDPDSCVSSTSCVSCSPAWPTDKLRHPGYASRRRSDGGSKRSRTDKAPEIKVGPDDAVITLKGFCSDTTQQGDACKTVISRAQFEKLAESLQPGMSPAIRRQLATAYSRMLRMSTAAEKRGLDKQRKFEEKMDFARMQVLSGELSSALQEDAGKVTRRRYR